MKFSPDEKKALEKAFDLYCKNSEYPSEEELSAIEFSPEFEEKMRAIINGRNPMKVHNYKRVMQRVAGIVIVLGVMAGSFALGTFAEPTYPEKKVKDIIDIYNNYIYETDRPVSDYYILSYVAEGYTEGVGKGDSKCHSVDYINQNSERIIFKQYRELPLPSIDRFADVHEEVEGGLYVHNSNSGESRYIWSDYGYVFDLRTDNCSKEEIVKMAKSVVRE